MCRDISPLTAWRGSCSRLLHTMVYPLCHLSSNYILQVVCFRKQRQSDDCQEMVGAFYCQVPLRSYCEISDFLSSLKYTSALLLYFRFDDLSYCISTNLPRGVLSIVLQRKGSVPIKSHRQYNGTGKIGVLGEDSIISKDEGYEQDGFARIAGQGIGMSPDASPQLEHRENQDRWISRQKKPYTFMVRKAYLRNRSSMRRKWNSAADVGAKENIISMQHCKKLECLEEYDLSFLQAKQKNLLTSNQTFRHREQLSVLSSKGDFPFDGKNVPPIIFTSLSLQ